MAKENNFLGVAEFKIGVPGDGVMGTALTNFPDVEVGSVTIEGSQSNTETIATENNDIYISLNGESTPASVTARLLGVPVSDYPALMGGTVDSGIWNSPVTPPVLHKSFEMIGKAIGGKKGILRIPFGKLDARIQGTITKNGLPAIDITIMANTPISASGVKGSPYSIGTIDE